MTRPTLRQLGTVFLRSANSIAGLTGNISVLHKLPHLIVWLIPAAIVGGVVGSEFGSRRLNPAALRRLLAVALVVAAVKMIWPHR